MRTIGIVILLGLTIPGRAQALSSISVDECLAAQLKIVGRGAAAFMTCYAKSAALGTSVDSECLTKATAKVDPAFAGLDYRKVCLVEGSGAERSNRSAAFAADVDTTVGHAAGKCDTTKLKLVAKYVRKLASCYATGAARFGTIDGTCIGKASVRFTSGNAKAQAGPDCSNTGQNAALTDAVETFVHAEACALDPGNPQCA